MGDSLLNDQFPDLKADYIIVNPPFNVSQWHPEDLPENDYDFILVAYDDENGESIFSKYIDDAQLKNFLTHGHQIHY